MIKVGVTGGIGSGKTTVLNFFKDLGIPTYIADVEAKKLMHTPPVKKEITALFGSKSFIENELNRPFIAQKVFQDKALLEKLNAIVHPRVEQHFEEWVKKQKTTYIVYEAAILFETGRYKDFDYTILVTAPYEKRIKRLQKRDQSTREAIEARIQNQWPDEKKKKLADWVVENDSLLNTYKQVGKIHAFLSNN